MRGNNAKLPSVSREQLMAIFSESPALCDNHKAMREAVARSLQELLGSTKVTSGAPAETLAAHFAHAAAAADPLALDAYLRFINEVVVKHSINMSSPRCLGHMTSGVAPFVSPLTDIVIALNQNLAKREASRVISLLERQVLAMLHRLAFSFPEEFYVQHSNSSSSTLGIVASGGTLSNLAALWCARSRAFPETSDFPGVDRAGMVAALKHYESDRAVVLCSALAHYSVDKAAALLGLGDDNIIKLPVDGRQRLDVAALAQTIEDCIRLRHRIVAVIGVAGSTDCGSIDPLPQIADLAERHRLHFHVDAAWGGVFLFADAHRRRLAGIERADTITLDGHKQLRLPISTSALLFRDRSCASVLKKRANYMLQDDSNDLGQISVEGSRNASSLFTHAALHVVGERGYSALVDRSLANTRAMSKLVSASAEFEILLEPETNVLLYRYIPAPWREKLVSGAISSADGPRLNAINSALQKAQYEAGRTYVSRTTLTTLPRYEGVPIVALRAVLGNPSTSVEDIQAVLQDQIRIATGIEAEALDPSAQL
jgi:putative pyridoxal-dependent aspartate 1-decarboxylase